MMENALSVNITRQGGYPYQSAATGEINYNDTCFYRRTGVTDGLTLRWVTDRFVLSGISSVQYIDDNMTLDQDFTPLDYFTLSQRRKEWAVTQDVVAKSVGDGSYRWLARRVRLLQAYRYGGTGAVQGIWYQDIDRG